MNRNKIHKLILLTFSILLIISSCKNQLSTVEPPAKIEFSVLAWNIWHGAKNPALNEDGRPHVIGIIKALNPDIVLMVETYGSGKMIADALGYYFHLIAPENTAPDDGRINLSIMSRYPMGNRFDFYNHFNIGGIEIFLNDTAKIHAFSIWLNYRPWEDDPITLNKSPEELIEWEKSGSRPAELDVILKGLKPYLDVSDEVPLILGGDFNIWSHLDWQENTKMLHNNMIVKWWTTSTIEKAGLIDSYRKVNSNALTHPGITWDLPGLKDEHRIDYIFYKSKKIEAVRSETYMVPYNDTITINEKAFMYPSDHGFVFTTFKWD